MTILDFKSYARNGRSTVVRLDREQGTLLSIALVENEVEVFSLPTAPTHLSELTFTEYDLRTNKRGPRVLVYPLRDHSAPPALARS